MTPMVSRACHSSSRTTCSGMSSNRSEDDQSAKRPAMVFIGSERRLPSAGQRDLGCHVLIFSRRVWTAQSLNRGGWRRAKAHTASPWGRRNRPLISGIAFAGSIGNNPREHPLGRPCAGGEQQNPGRRSCWLARAIHDWEKKIDVYHKDSWPTIACQCCPGGLG